MECSSKLKIIIRHSLVYFWEYNRQADNMRITLLRASCVINNFIKGKHKIYRRPIITHPLQNFILVPLTLFSHLSTSRRRRLLLLSVHLEKLNYSLGDVLSLLNFSWKWHFFLVSFFGMHICSCSPPPFPSIIKSVSNSFLTV